MRGIILLCFAVTFVVWCMVIAPQKPAIKSLTNAIVAFVE